MQPNAVLEMPPVAVTAPGEVLSPSQASTFLSCSAKWFFRYVMGLNDPAGGGAVRGKAVHAVIAHYLWAQADGVAIEPAGVADAYDQAWDANAEGAEFLPTDDVEALKTSGLRLAAKYIAEAAPAIKPAAIELPVTGVIGGVNVRGYVDIVDVSGKIIDIKTASRKSSSISADHAFQLATYAALTPGASGEARIDQLVSTKETQLVQLDHTPGEAGQRLVERIYPLVAEGIAAGRYWPNRSSTLCSRRYCSFWSECQREFGGTVE